MNRAFRQCLAALLLLLATGATAQRYIVYSATSHVQLLKDGRHQPLLPRTTLSNNSKVVIGKESSLVVLDEKSQKMYSFTREGISSVATLVADAKSNAKNISKQYFSYLVKQLFADGSQKKKHPDTYMQAMGTSYRSTAADSLLLCAVCELTPQADGAPAEPFLREMQGRLSSAYDVGFELMDCETHQPVATDCEDERSCYVRISNKSDEMLYVNVLNLSSDGSKYLVLPVDEEALCAHLIVPAKSTVAFDNEPFIFSGSNTTETFLLVATPDPVDFSILMNPIQASGKHRTMPIGVSRHSFQLH